MSQKKVELCLTFFVFETLRVDIIFSPHPPLSKVEVLLYFIVSLVHWKMAIQTLDKIISNFMFLQFQNVIFCRLNTT